MINLKVRFKNKAFVVSFVTIVLAFVYQLLGLFEIVPPIGEDQVIQLLTLVVNLLAALGILVDPTTKGISDSEQALTYEEPK